MKVADESALNYRCRGFLCGTHYNRKRKRQISPTGYLLSLYNLVPNDLFIHTFMRGDMNQSLSVRSRGTVNVGRSAFRFFLASFISVTESRLRSPTAFRRLEDASYSYTECWPLFPCNQLGTTTTTVLFSLYNI